MKIWELEKNANRCERLVPEFGNKIWHTIMSAIENAIETVGKDEGEEFERMALATLEENLAYNTFDLSKEQFAWFEAQGVRW